MSNKAKSFKAVNHFNKAVNIEEFKGQKIWLAFYRYASCPLCNLHMNSIVKRYQEVKDAGLVFLPVFQSSPSEVQKYAGKDDLPFPIICDPEEVIYKMYDVGKSYGGFMSMSVMVKGVKAMLNGHLPGKMEGEISRLPSEFIINENFEIEFRYDGKDIGDHPSLDLILEKASEL